MRVVPEDVAPAAKPRLSPEERPRRWEERLAAVRLRVAIGRELDERGITDSAAIGAALGRSAAEATKLLTRRHPGRRPPPPSPSGREGGGRGPQCEEDTLSWV
jgi:hypothetical protein